MTKRDLPNDKNRKTKIDDPDEKSQVYKPLYANGDDDDDDFDDDDDDDDLGDDDDFDDEDDEDDDDMDIDIEEDLQDKSSGKKKPEPPSYPPYRSI